ncbi:MAG TPA: ABC transporter substrate-binding protein, partial [Nitrolancea sp.]|nr:ABC transporter substrate-binding protein [Nitrolancea sp.]
MKKILLASATLLAVVAGAHAASAAAIKQGGAMVVSFKDDMATLDPAIGYDWQNWSIIKSLYSRLMDYVPGTTTLRPDLAESFDVAPDGLTYTFKLRHGVKFHNGRELTADDVIYSLDRTVNPKTQSPGASFYHSIKGYDDVQGGKADHLAGVTAVDPYTVKIELSTADATFLHELALNFASVVAKEDVAKYGADYGHHPDGSGAFFVSDWTLGQHIILQRNKDYYWPGIPYLDQITFDIGQDPVVDLLRLQKGEVDVLGDGIPPAKYAEVMADPNEKANVVTGPQLQTVYVTMNTTMKPFDDVRVRKAVNMAINKDRIIQIINGRAIPANQPLPNRIPGYDKDYKGYPYDVAGAKDLLKQAGLEAGFDTELYVSNVDPNPRIGQAIQQDLAAIGIRASIKSLDQADVIAAGGTPNTAPMIWSGGMAWIADFPDPSDFYGPILGCGGATQGGWNWSWYCNKDRDAEAKQADSIIDPAKQDERYDEWRQFFDKIMDDAPWVPVFDEVRYTLHTSRIAGDPAMFNDPIRIPVNYENVYATDA